MRVEDWARLELHELGLDAGILELRGLGRVGAEHSAKLWYVAGGLRVGAAWVKERQGWDVYLEG